MQVTPPRQRRNSPALSSPTPFTIPRIMENGSCGFLVDRVNELGSPPTESRAFHNLQRMVMTQPLPNYPIPMSIATRLEAQYAEEDALAASLSPSRASPRTPLLTQHAVFTPVRLDFDSPTGTVIHNSIHSTPYETPRSQISAGPANTPSSCESDQCSSSHLASVPSTPVLKRPSISVFQRPPPQQEQPRPQTPMTRSPQTDLINTPQTPIPSTSSASVVPEVPSSPPRDPTPAGLAAYIEQIITTATIRGEELGLRNALAGGITPQFQADPAFKANIRKVARRGAEQQWNKSYAQAKLAFAECALRTYRYGKSRSVREWLKSGRINNFKLKKIVESMLTVEEGEGEGEEVDIYDVAGSGQDMPGASSDLVSVMLMSEKLKGAFKVEGRGVEVEEEIWGIILYVYREWTGVDLVDGFMQGPSTETLERLTREQQEMVRQRGSGGGSGRNRDRLKLEDRRWMFSITFPAPKKAEIAVTVAEGGMLGWFGWFGSCLGWY